MARWAGHLEGRGRKIVVQWQPRKSLNEIQFEKQTEKQKGWRQGCLPSQHDTLNLNPGTAKKREKKGQMADKALVLDVSVRVFPEKTGI
jgi:hypothetical protein